MRKENSSTDAKKESQLGAILKRLSKNKMAMFGLAILIVLVLIAVFAPWIARFPYEEMHVLDKHQTPNATYWFGTDELGRDIFSRIVYGARYSLSLGFSAVLFANVIGIIIGAIAGYVGGRTDNILMRLLDVFQAIPGMLLGVIISSVLGSGFTNTILAMAIGNIPMAVRLLRGQVMSIRKLEYLEAAEAINCTRSRIIVRHVLPNSYAPLLVSATMGIGNTIMAAAALSFIGLGIQPPTPEWGAMLTAAKSFFRDHPHEMLFPGLFIMLTVLALNMFGDGLRDALDPKLKN